MGPESTIVLTLAWAQWLLSWPLALRLRGLSQRGGAGDAASQLSIVIPARNEAENLPVLLGSLAAQDAPPLEVILVDDHSSDGTAEIAAKYGARVISAEPLPAGYRGKPWACLQGAEAARGELLMFIDADCRLEKGGLARLLEQYPGGAFAVLPYHTVRRPYEELSAMFNLIMAAGSLPSSLLGQCLLISRDDYRRSGGYAAVAKEIMENVMLGRACSAAGVKTGSCCGKGALSMRMYPGGLGSLIEGWTKGFSQGARLVPRSTLLLISAWIGGLITAVAALAATPWMALAYLAFAVQMAVMLRRIGNFSLLTALLYPLPLAFYLIVFLRSLLGGGREATWKGRKLHVD